MGLKASHHPRICHGLNIRMWLHIKSDSTAFGRAKTYHCGEGRVLRYQVFLQRNERSLVAHGVAGGATVKNVDSPERAYQ